EDRAQAVARMRRALDEYAVGGIQTNLAFHRRLIRHPGFLAGEYDTGFIGREPSLTTAGELDSQVRAGLLAAAGIAEAGRGQGAQPTAPAGGPARASSWRRGGRTWRG